VAIRFHLDEHISPIVADILRRYGIDATTTQEARLLSQPDDDQLSWALTEQRALVTCDAGFTNPAIVAKAKSGICFCPLHKYSTGQIAEALRIVAGCLTEQEMQNRLEYL
jgi:predicted nuclease of predicted toxin-antitoxin system